MFKHQKKHNSERSTFGTYFAQILILIFVFLPILWGFGLPYALTPLISI